jgi:hypothetical protein
MEDNSLRRFLPLVPSRLAQELAHVHLVCSAASVAAWAEARLHSVYDAGPQNRRPQPAHLVGAYMLTPAA